VQGKALQYPERGGKDINGVDATRRRKKMNGHQVISF